MGTRGEVPPPSSHLRPHLPRPPPRLAIGDSVGGPLEDGSSQPKLSDVSKLAETTCGSLAGRTFPPSTHLLLIHFWLPHRFWALSRCSSPSLRKKERNHRPHVGTLQFLPVTESFDEPRGAADGLGGCRVGGVKGWAGAVGRQLWEKHLL